MKGEFDNYIQKKKRLQILSLSFLMSLFRSLFVSFYNLLEIQKQKERKRKKNKAQVSEKEIRQKSEYQTFSCRVLFLVIQ